MDYMKNFWRALFCAAVLSFASCDQLPEDPSGTTGGNLDLEIIGEPTSTSNSATVTMDIAEGVTEYAYTYYMADKRPTKSPAASRLFRDADKIKDCEPGEQDITFTGLHPNTEYVFYVAFRCGTKVYDKVFEFEVTTSKIEAEFSVEDRTLEGFTIYMKLPDEVRQRGNVIRYNSCDIVTYNENRMIGKSDNDMLSFNASKWFGELGSSNSAHNSDELYYVMNMDNCYERDANGEMIYDEEGNPLLVAMQVVPGEPTVFIAGEYADETYLGLPWQGAQFDYEGYYEDNGGSGETTDSYDKTAMDRYWYGYFMRHEFYSLEPQSMEADIKITVPTEEEVGAISATLIIEPDDDITEFCIYVIDQSSYQNSLLPYLEGREELMQWFTTSSYAFNIGSRVIARPESGKWEPVSIMVDEGINMTPNTTYNVYVVGVGDPSLSHQCFKTATFKTREKQLDTPEVVVTPIDNPDGEDPFEVWYNVKCTTKNAVSGRYACNDTDSWVKMLNSGYGYTNATLLNYSEATFTQEEIDKINSSAGLNMNFPALEGATMRLAVAVFNAENDANDINSPSDATNPAIADQTTGYLLADERVEHEYLDNKTLNGEWTLSANSGYFEDKYVPDENGGYTDSAGNKYSLVQEWKEEVIKSKVVIMTEVPCPDEITQEVRDAYPNMSDEKLEELFSSFKHAVDVYNASIRGKNRLILLGFNDQGEEDLIQEKPMLPFDLFIDQNYNGFDVNAILRDWGPKWFIEFTKDEKGQIVMTVPFNSQKYQPMTQCGPYPLYMAAMNHTNAPNADTGKYSVTYRHVGTGNETLSFPVTVSGNVDKITIDPLYVSGVVADDGTPLPLYPNRVYSDMTSYSVMYPVYMEAPVLTPGWTEDTESSVVPSAAAARTCYPSNMPLYTPASKSNVRSAWNITPFDNITPETATATVKDDVKYRTVVYKVADPSTIAEKIHEVSVRKYNLEK